MKVWSWDLLLEFVRWCLRGFLESDSMTIEELVAQLEALPCKSAVSLELPPNYVEGDTLEIVDVRFELVVELE